MQPKQKSAIDYAIPIIILVVSIFISLHMAVAYDTVKEQQLINQAETSSNVKFDYTMFFNIFQTRVDENPTSVTWSDSSLKFLGIALFILLIAWGYYATSRKKFITGKEYGSAEWGTAKQLSHLKASNIKASEIKAVKKSKKRKSEKTKEIKELNLMYADTSNILFTNTEKICMYNYELNNNTMLIGGSGSGKTRGYVLPNILQCCNSPYSPSIVVTDPKGEILTKVGKYLTDCGYEIRVLNLKEQNRSFCFNPFSYIREDNYEEGISSLVSSIMDSRSESNQKSNDPFWDDMAKVLLKSIFYATYEGFNKEEQNMNTVMALFRWFEVSDKDDRYKNPTKLDTFFKVFAEDEEIAEKYGTVNTNPALRNWEDFRTKCKGKTAQSVTATALAKISPFDEEQIRRIFSKDEMELDLVGERKTALFIILPPTNKTYNFMANVLYTQLFEQLEYCATVKHNQQLPVPVRFILDEFYNTGKIPNFENILSYARSFGIGIAIVLQSLDQIKEMYEKSWGTVLDNCSTFLYLGGIRHFDTLDYISKLLGKGTFDKKNYSQTKGRQSSSSISYDKIGRELLDPAEIQKMKKSKCLFFVSGYNPYFSTKFNYKNHKNYKFTSDFNKKNLFQYQLPSEEVGADEDVTNNEFTHGEDIQERKKDRTEPIILNANSDEAVQFLEDNLLSVEILDIEDITDDEIILSEAEVSRYEIQREAIDEVEKAEDEANKILSNIAKQRTKPVVLETNEEVIIETISKQIQDETTEFIRVSDDKFTHGEDENLNSMGEIWLDDDLEQMLDDVSSQVKDLYEDMNLFEESLKDIDDTELVV